MKSNQNIIDCYNKTATSYAEKYLNELDHKHLDRILLQSFATENKDRGKLIDFGCGPGQTTNFLFGCGCTNLIGIDITPAMVEVAQLTHPNIPFEVADMLQLPYPDQSFGSAIAFYAIVHFDEEQLRVAFREINRVLAAGGQFLFSFHIGNHIVLLNQLLEQEVNIDFYFFETSKIIASLTDAGFETIDVIERQPYQGVEYASIRAYIWARKIKISK